MALNLLPMLLIGTGAAYVYTKQKEKAKLRSGDNCPSENTITINESVAAFKQAQTVHGKNVDPFPQAQAYIRTLLPKECNQKSVGSRIKMGLEFEGKKADLALTVPDFYMIGLLGAIGDRVESGMITEAQGRQFFEKGLNWYKDLMDKPFDPQTLGLDKFMQAFALAMFESLKDAIEDGLGGQCPPHVAVSFSEQSRIEMMNLIKNALSSGERNPEVIADELFKNTMPDSCQRNNYKTVVDLTIEGQHFKTYDAASYYAAMVHTVLEVMIDSGILTEAVANQIVEGLRSDYKKLTGKELSHNLT